MIHIFDGDPRAKDEDYRIKHGSFGALCLNYNDQLKKLGLYSELDDAEFVGKCGSLDPQFQMVGKKTFYINVWETANTLPIYLLQAADSVNQRIFGLSNQITNLWRKYGFEADTVYGGCDTTFWYQTKPKRTDKFVFLHVNHGNVRSGLDLTLKAFQQAFAGNKDVVLIVKDSAYNEKLESFINTLRDNGCSIDYQYEMLTTLQMRDLYSEAHVCLNLIRSTSFGLPLLESSACGCYCVTGDTAPTNEIITPDYGMLIPPKSIIPIYAKSTELEQEIGLKNYYGSFQYPEEPMFYDFDLSVYAYKLIDIFNNYQDTYSKVDTRTPVVTRWNWEIPTKKLAELLTK